MTRESGICRAALDARDGQPQKPQLLTLSEITCTWWPVDSQRNGAAMPSLARRSSAKCAIEGIPVSRGLSPGRLAARRWASWSL